MYTNAPIHDLLIRIKNAYMARRLEVKWVIYSKFKEEVLKLLKEYKFISNYKVEKDWNKAYIIVYLNEVYDKVLDIPKIKFFSKPSRRWYVSYKDLKPVASGQWIWIISTNQWVMPTHIAKKKKLWWELIAEIY